MKAILSTALAILAAGFVFEASAQMVSPTAGPGKTKVLERTVNANGPTKSNGSLPFDAALAPFYHGVASGDPLTKRVIIWTRRTPDGEQTSYNLGWQVATDPEMQNIVKQGTVEALASRDYTAKVDVAGLTPATTYYYRFGDFTSQVYSITGRTRTAPEFESDHLRFAVVSCNNYQAGYYNAFRKIGLREDLDAVLHLGDYIYEYGAGEGTYGYSADRPDRSNVPASEILTLADYRTRYSLYRLDSDLRLAHQQHPFITVWDDHESANDSYKDGAENHNEGEGDWEVRKAISKQVYYEWMPIRELPEDRLYRKHTYGSLAELIMIDTRLEGREAPPLLASDTTEYRTILGEDQVRWTQRNVKNSSSQWKIIGNQVIFSPFNVGFGAENPTDLLQITLIESIFVDIWDGYPKERERLLNALEAAAIDNVVILTGDFHCSFAFDVTNTPVVYPNPLAFNFPTPSPTYNPSTGEGSLAVEFATPSISSANFDENLTPEESFGIEAAINANIPVGPPLGTVNYNPHLKYVDLDRHGYTILDLTPEAAQADWYYVNILTANDDFEEYGAGMLTNDGDNHLTVAPAPAANKVNPPALAPFGPPADSTAGKLPSFAQPESQSKIALFNLYPNPATSGAEIYIMAGYQGDGQLAVELFDIAGRLITKHIAPNAASGNFAIAMPVEAGLAPGVYFIKLGDGVDSISRKLVIE